MREIRTSVSQVFHRRIGAIYTQTRGTDYDHSPLHIAPRPHLSRHQRELQICGMMSMRQVDDKVTLFWSFYRRGLTKSLLYSHGIDQKTANVWSLKSDYSEWNMWVHIMNRHQKTCQTISKMKRDWHPPRYSECSMVISTERNQFTWNQFQRGHCVHERQ